MSSKLNESPCEFRCFQVVALAIFTLDGSDSERWVRSLVSTYMSRLKASIESVS